MHNHLGLTSSQRTKITKPQKTELLWFWYLFASISSSVYARAYCSDASLTPPTWMAETHSAVYTEGQKELSTGSKVDFFWRKKCKRRNTRGNWGDAVMRTAFLLSHFLCLTIANNHPIHTRLFNWAVYTQDACSTKEEIVFPVQLARGTRACPENTSVGATPTAQGLYTCEQKVTHTATTTRSSHTLGALGPLESICQSCAKSTCYCRKVWSKTGSPPCGSQIPVPFCCHLLA